MTLAELLVAAALTAGVAGGVFAAVGPAQASFATDQERADLHQRMRFAIDTLARDLRAAALARPHRAGAAGDDPAAGVHFRPDTLTIVFPDPLVVRPSDDRRRSYYLRAEGDASQLMQFDGIETALPVVDDVVALGFEYFGEPQPPRTLPDEEPVGLTVPVSYGPSPPGLTTDDPGDAWGPGENCTFAVIEGRHLSRLVSFAGTEPVPLPSELLTDGPWCPDGESPDRFDADLLRVRLVRVRLRLQARAPFRGASRQLFAHPGTASEARRSVPDQEVRIDVALRNWNATPGP
jgi:hypothetical protein